jgi:hypothetical protein
MRSRALRRTAGWPLPRGSLVVVIVAIALRLALLMIFGPRPSHDGTYEYIPFAQLIRHGGDWMSDAGLATTPIPVSAFRMIGYPALIALSDVIAGDGWPWLLVALQIVCSMAAILTAMALAAALEPQRTWVALAAGVGMACGQTLITDTIVQTDSIAAAALFIFAALCAMGALRRGPLSAAKAIGLGLLPMLCFLLRENTDVTVLTLLPFTMSWILRTERSRWRQIGLTILVVLPLIAANTALLAWNFHRAGTGFVTTGTQTILLQPLLHAASRGAPLFDGDSILDQAAAQVVAAKEHPDGEFSTDELLAVNQQLFEHGSNALEIAGLMRRAYIAAWSHHPIDMLQASFAELPGELFISLGDSVRMKLGALFADRSTAPDGTAPPIAIALSICAASLALRALSFVVTMAFLLGPVIALGKAALMHRPLRESDWFRLAALLAGLAFIWLHAIVHFEERYLAPVEPLAIISGLTALAQLSAWCNRRLSNE